MSAQEAVERARKVVGLYGDPTISWSIGLHAEVSSRLGVADLAERLDGLVADHPHLGQAPAVVTVAADAVSRTVQRFLDDPFGDRDPLLRVALSDDGRALVLAAHHGAVDGLGLLAVLGRLLHEPVGSTSRGIGSRRSSRRFLSSSLRRLAEAVFRPPSRCAADRRGQEERGRRGDVFAVRHLDHSKAGTGLVTLAASRAMRRWNAARGVEARRVVVAVGASRRRAGMPSPDRDTAYLRITVDATSEVADVVDQLEAADPEPDFPATRGPGRLAEPVARVLRGRLGSSLMVSNLGQLTGSEGLQRLAFYPAAAGPRAVAVGVASTQTVTSMTVRMSSADFVAVSAVEMVDAIAAEVEQLPQ